MGCRSAAGVLPVADAGTGAGRRSGAGCAVGCHSAAGMLPVAKVQRRKSLAAIEASEAHKVFNYIELSIWVVCSYLYRAEEPYIY